MNKHRTQPRMPVSAHRPIVLAVAAALAAGAALPAQAEDELEQIVVTAQSRRQAEQDVPIAMQVVTVKQIEDLGATSLADISGYVPGLQVDGSQPTQPNFTIRGVGTSDFGIGTDAPVGVYVDGVYTGKTGGSLMSFDDVKQVEVLKGPQGTHFGRNSAAGAISVMTNEPDISALDATGLVRYGQYRRTELQGMVNVPVSDTAAFRVSMASKHSNGWWNDVATGERFGGDGDWGTRAAFKWAPNAQTKLVGSWEHEDLDQAARAVLSLVNVPPGTAPATLPNPAGTNFVDPLSAPLQNDAPNRESRTYDGLTLRFETPLAGMDFSSTTAYRHFRTHNLQDNDGTASALTYLSTDNQEVNSSFQQEFKLGAKTTLLDWVAGASFYHDDAGQVTDAHSTTDTIDTLSNFRNDIPGVKPAGVYAPGFGLVDLLNAGVDQQLAALGLGPLPANFGLGLPWLEQMINSNRTTSYALYGDAIVHLPAETNLTFGLRWTRDHKDVSWYTPAYVSPIDNLYLAATGSTFGQLAGPSVTGIPGAVLTNVIFSNSASTPVSAARSWSDLSPRLVLDHKIDRDQMVYASVSRGYQSGGYDAFNPLAAFEPEHMTNFEVGYKGAFPRWHATLDASVFHYRFTNLQNITLVSTPGTLPVYDVTTSDEKATGADLAGHMEVVKNVGVFGSVEYIDQKYGRYDFNENGTIIPMDGQPVGTPLFTISLGTRLAWDSDVGRFEYLLQGNHTTSTRCNPQIVYGFGCLDTGNTHTGTQTTRVDMRLGWMAPNRHYGAALLLNNALGQQYFLPSGGGGESGYTVGTPYGTLTAPRSWLLELSASL